MARVTYSCLWLPMQTRGHDNFRLAYQKKKKDNLGLFSKTFWSREESFTKFYKITDRIIKIKK